MSDIEIEIVRAKVAAIEARLAKGWDYLDEHPELDRPGQAPHELWMNLLGQYQDEFRRLQRLTGKERP